MSDKCYELESQGRKQYFFVAEYKSGKIGSGKCEEMANINYEKYEAYIPEIISVNKIKNIRLLPKEIKDIIISDLNDIFKKEISS